MLIAIALTLLANQTPIRVTPPEFVTAREPQIAIDRDETVYVTYGMGDTSYVSVSTDGGLSYGPPFVVGSPGKLSLGMRRGPRIAARDGVLTVTAIYGNQGKGRDGDLVAFRSLDRGKTWSAPVAVNSVSGSAREGLHAMAQAPNGTIVSTWLDLRDKGTKLLLATSRDDGATWSKNVVAYQSPSGTICECCHPSLAFDKSGNLLILFRNSVDGARDMYLMSTKTFQVFTPAVKLGQGTWVLQACPMDGGMLAVLPNGKVETVWRREDTLYTSGGANPEVRIGIGRQPWITASSRGTYITWQSERSVMLASPGEPARQISPEGLSPVVVASPSGKTVIAAWTQKGVAAIRISP